MLGSFGLIRTDVSHGLLENMLTLSQFIADARRTSALVTEWSQNWGHSAKLSC